MTYNEETMRDLYWVIEELLCEMEMSTDFDPNYCDFCRMLDRYDEGDRSLGLFTEMRRAYAYS